MFGQAETTLKAFSDGFGCMAVTDVGDTEECIVQLMMDESPWEVIDGIQNLPAGHYLVKISYWYEDNFPEPGCDLVAEVTGHEQIDTAQEGSGDE